jgi:P-type Mg2+ transporter
MKLNTLLHLLKTGFHIKRTQHALITEQQISAALLNYSKMPLEKLFATLKSSPEGLGKKEVKKRLKKYGFNEIAREKPATWYSLLFNNFTNPFVLLTCVLAVVSLFLQQYDAVVIMSFMVVVSVLMRFIQEYRSNKAAEQLRALVSTKATVVRRSNGVQDTKSLEINMKQLVPGDIILLSAGDLVPADVRLISSKELCISQSALSGESFPVEKDSTLSAPENSSTPLAQPNLCLLGTDVLNGSAKAIVIATNNNTYFGTLSTSIVAKRPLTSFDIGINKVTWLLIKFILVMIPCVFLINGLSKGDWPQALLFALAVAIGLTPEMLPMVVTANLARGAVKMSKSKVVVKQLNSIQNFGAMDVLCTDKTGTLTQDRIILEKHLDPDGNENEQVLLYGYLNSFYQTGLKNLMDIAVLEHTEIEAKLKSNSSLKKIDEIPFDFNRRRMSVIVQKDPDSQLLICKGAFEETLALCTSVQTNDTQKPLTPAGKTALDALKKELNDDGLRVLAVAYKELPITTKKEFKISDEQELTFMGFLAFLDPPKASAEKAIAELKAVGVQIKVLTGDNALVTQKICKWVNLEIQGTLLGDEIAQLSDDALKHRVEEVNVFAKMTPLQKARVVTALKSNGHTVGFLGDGINDAPALRAADVGISVDTAVDIAKETANIIMLEKDLMFLVQGVLEGRKTFGNIIKYIKMALSSNFGNVFSILGASALLPFLPMLSVQLLLQNLLYDLSQTTIPFDNVDEEFLQKPRKWDSAGIAKFMLFIGPTSSIFDYATFGLMWFVFAANSVETQALFQSGWFIEGLLSQTLIVHMIRTQKIPLLQSRASLPLLLTTALIMIIGIYIPYSSVGASIGLVGLPLQYFYWLFFILLSYCTLTQLVKVWFIKKFNYWL